MGRFPAGDLVDGPSRWGDVFDDDPADATAGHLGDLIAAAFVLNALPNSGDVAQMREEKAGESLDAGFAWKGPMKLVAQIA